MLDETLDLDDLKTVDPEYHHGLMDILGSPLESIGMDGLSFTTETSFFGKISTVDLVSNGSTLTVRSFRPTVCWRVGIHLFLSQEFKGIIQRINMMSAFVLVLCYLMWITCGTHDVAQRQDSVTCA